MNKMYAVLMIAVIALVTALIRFLPFIIFSGKKEPPKLLSYLGKYLPYAIIGMLVVYCYKGASVLQKPYGAPEWIAGLLVVVLHAWKRNTLLSIISGTIAYMLLIQFVF